MATAMTSRPCLPLLVKPALLAQEAHRRAELARLSGDNCRSACWRYPSPMVLGGAGGGSGPGFTAAVPAGRAD